MRPWTCRSVGVGVLGLFLLSFGTCLYFLYPFIFDNILRKELPLTPTSKAYELWKDTSGLPPMYMKIYFFNWTNPEELRTKKPELVQLGPYAFREVRKKVNIMFHPENDTVSYYQQRYWYFDEKESNGSLTDTVTQLNIVAISAAHKVRYWEPVIQGSLSLLLKTSQIYVRKTVDELLFAGYADSLIELGKMAITDDEELPPFDRFGWFYMRNGSMDFDGRFNMDTGTGDLRNFGVLRRWNNGDTTKYHKSPCNIVEGSAGEFWPPYRTTKEDVTLFSADLCRPLIYEFSEETTYNGVKGYTYALGDKTLGNETKRRYPHEQVKYFERTTTTEDFFAAEHSAEVVNPSNEDPDLVNVGHCYCSGKCSPVGLMNITSCRYGAPAFVSLPHFHKGDPSLQEQVVGMNPTSEHDFYITLEPNTGIPLDVSANLQVNILLQPSESVSLFKDVPTIYFPVFWFSLNAKATEDLTSELWLLLAVNSICMYTGIVLVITGAVIIFVVALLPVLKRQRTRSIANNRNIRAERISATGVDKSESVYMDKGNPNDDPHVKSDRRLYPSSIERFNMDLQSSFPGKLQHQCERKSNACE